MKYATPLNLFILVMLCSLFFLVEASRAQDLKSRMIERLPIIVELKEKGIIGEDNMGFLQFIGPQKEQEEVVKAENRDRATVYGAIAKQQGTTVEKVGRRRALQIAEKAKSGEWLQDSAGKWYQKP